MAYDATKPTDDEYLSVFPAEMREQLRAIIQDAIVNALTVKGYSPGNLNGNIPVSNGNLNANLNADKLDGYDATYFSADGHVHAAATQSSNGFMSNTDKNKVDSIATGAEVNQNAFSNVAVGSTTIQADSKTDTLTLAAGANIEITPDATNDKVTVAVTGTVPTATTANAMNNQGDKTAIEDGTKEPAGLNLYKVCYNGYPALYGNLLSIGGQGGGELLAEWSGLDKGIGHLYYRNRRDVNALWSGWRVVAFTSDINSYAPTLTGGGASGTWPISISGNAAAATKVNNTGDRGNLASGQKPTSGLQVFQCHLHAGYPQQYGNVLSIGGTGDSEFFLGWQIDARPFYRSKTDVSNDWTDWKALAYISDINSYAPTLTGGGASGTWPISISGNADTVDGYHASDLFRHLGGNQTPVITDIFDRAGTIDMSTMSEADKATHKANINKAPNMTQNLWNNGTGILAYGGDTDIAGYNRGTLKLTQSWKNFDKLMITYCGDDSSQGEVRMFDVYEFNYCMTNMHFFNIVGDGVYWQFYGLTNHCNDPYFKPSTETVLSCRDQNSGLIGIYGIKY